MERLYIDYDSCIGCDLCAMSCSLEKTGRINPARSRIQLVKVEHEGIIMPAVCPVCGSPVVLFWQVTGALLDHIKGFSAK